MPSLNKGSMIILSSPSGAGKTTLVKKISKNKNFSVSISHTTRLPRPNEKNGKDYYFISKNYFKRLIKKGEFLEHAKVFDNYYGSSKGLVTEKIKKGKNIVFDIDWQGTRQIRNLQIIDNFYTTAFKKGALHATYQKRKKKYENCKKKNEGFHKRPL